MALDRARTQAQAIIDRVAGHDPAAGCVLDRAIPCLTQTKEFAGLVKAQKAALKDLDAKLKKADQAQRKGHELAGQIREVDQAVLYAQNQIGKIDDQIAKAGQAGDQVRKIKDEQDVTKAHLAKATADEADLERDVAKLEATLDVATQYQAATSGRADALARKAILEQDVIALEALVDKLGPKGIRMTALAQALGDFEQAVNAALETVGFALTFGDPWAVRVNGRPYDLLSDGEKLAVGTAFQNALAAISGLNLVAVDATETTVGTLRQAVTAVLMMSPVDQVLVAIAKGPDDPVPAIDGLQVVRLGPVQVHA
jgi:small-conductance mechanosensitive channel